MIVGVTAARRAAVRLDQVTFDIAAIHFETVRFATAHCSRDTRQAARGILRFAVVVLRDTHAFRQRLHLRVAQALGMVFLGNHRQPNVQGLGIIFRLAHRHVSRK